MRELEALIKAHMEDERFMHVIRRGGPWSVFSDLNGVTTFECQEKCFKNGLPMTDLADVACGSMDHMGIRYVISIGGKSWDKEFYRIFKVGP